MPKGTLYVTKSKNVFAVCVRHHDGNGPEFVFAKVKRQYQAHGGVYLDLSLVRTPVPHNVHDAEVFNVRNTSGTMLPAVLHTQRIGDLVRGGSAIDCFVDPVPDDHRAMTLAQYCGYLQERGVNAYFTSRVGSLYVPGNTKAAEAARRRAERAFRIEFEDTFTEEFLNEVEGFVAGWHKRLQKRARS